MFFTAFIIAFVKQWKMTLVLICIIPAMAIPVVITTMIMQKHEKRSLDHYAEGATLAEEVISTVRVAQAFGTQERLVDKYDTYLVKAEKSGAMKSIVIAIQMFTIFFVIYAAEGLAFWYGAKLLVNGTITNSGTVITYTLPTASQSDMQCFFRRLDWILFGRGNCTQSSSVRSCLECLLQDLRNHRPCSPDRRLLRRGRPTKRGRRKPGIQECQFHLSFSSGSPSPRKYQFGCPTR